MFLELASQSFNFKKACKQLKIKTSAHKSLKHYNKAVTHEVVPNYYSPFYFAAITMKNNLDIDQNFTAHCGKFIFKILSEKNTVCVIECTNATNRQN